MNRREFLTKTTHAVVAGTAISQISQAVESQKRPNIFLLFSDDATAWDFGCYGNKVIKTQNIDRLAGEGMRFDNMFTPTPMCAPSRAARARARR